MSLALGLRAVVQSVVFVIVSRTLGVEQYGAFAAVLALAAIFASFGALGTPAVMLRDVSVAPGTFPSAWGKTLTVIGLSTPALLLVYLFLSWWALPSQFPIAVIVLVGIAEVILAPVSLSAITAYQSHERMGRAARLQLSPVVPRLIAALLLWPLAARLPSTMLLLAWAVLYALAALIAAVYAQWLVRRGLGGGLRPKLGSLWPTIREGLPFAAGNAAIKSHTDIDKTMLARLSTLEGAGAYSAGHRLVDLATIPIISLLSVSRPRFFRAATQGSSGIYSLVRGIIAVPAAYAILAGLSLYFLADFVPLLLGPDYADAVTVLRWLAWLPAVSLPRLLMQVVMASSHRQLSAVGILSIGAASNIGLNLWLIPTYGWQGAVIATYVTELMMAVLMLRKLAGASAVDSYAKES